MLLTAFKQSFAAALVLAVLAGCSGTSTMDDMDTAGSASDGGISTGTAQGADLTRTQIEDPAPELETVFYFEFDRALLTPELRSLLTDHADDLRTAPRSIRLEGHADERGTREYNMALGERRARAIRDYLVLQGVAPGMIEVVSYGEEYPAVMGSTESAYAKNRRVELK